MTTHMINGVAKKGWVEQHRDRLREAEKKAAIKAQQVGPRIEVVEDATGEVIHVVKLHGNSESHAERVERGLNINLDHERFTTRAVLEDE